MGRARPKGENEGRGKTSGATPGIPFAFVRRAFSLSLSRASFLSLSLSLASFDIISFFVDPHRLFSRIRALHTRVSSRSHTDINRDRILTYCLIIGPPREAACFSIPSLSLSLVKGRDPRDERW